MMHRPPLPSNFRKLSPAEKREQLTKYFSLTKEEADILSGHADLSDLSDVLIESAIGTFPVPFGLATGFLIDGRPRIVPMATEEPSVIAAASYAAGLVKAGSGFHTSASEPIVTTQIYLKNGSTGAQETVLASEPQIRRTVDAMTPKMLSRGGGYRGIEVERIDGMQVLCISIHLDVRDAMGANIANTVAEGLKELLKELTGGSVIMAILTNSSENRTARTEFETPEKYFSRGRMTGAQVCEKIVEANNLADHSPQRAITHNKGIMNGISALALATGNDTRAVEAAAHYAALADGRYRPLTKYEHSGGVLKGVLELPLPLGTVGGSVGIWPAARLSLRLLENPTASELSRIAASLGLAQNLAAVLALVTDGIQKGHMRLHAARAAWSAGARGREVRLLAEHLHKAGVSDDPTAQKLLNQIREKTPHE